MLVSVYIATSLDGFIARKNGSLDWLPGADGNDPGTSEDLGYEDFIKPVDTLIMGRGTFETVCTFGEWPYGDRQAYVLSSRKVEIPDGFPPNIHWCDLTPLKLVASLKGQDVHKVYLDGGKTIQSFLKEGLVDEITITRVPVLLGEGIPLFGAHEKDIKLQLLSSRSFNIGFVQDHYRVLK